ncbi:uncharacterized protein LOC135501143 [Lineus longissimus]|uniref:uncharacterized protein LOC135501143 n=1 Tax=Lineus longissimus TaxID=88925 RepID=UPI002B4D3777
MDGSPDIPEKKVLIGVDTSEHSDYAFQYYIEHLHQPNNLVILAHSSESPYHYAKHMGGAGYHSGPGGAFSPHIPHSTIAHLMDGQREEIRKITLHYETLLQRLKIKVKHKFAVNQHDGHPGQCLVDMANEENVSLVVVGSRGLGLLRRTILGSVSHYVLHHSKVPVIVCHIEKGKSNCCTAGQPVVHGTTENLKWNSKHSKEENKPGKHNSHFHKKHREKELGKTDGE